MPIYVCNQCGVILMRPCWFRCKAKKVVIKQLYDRPAPDYNRIDVV